MPAVPFRRHLSDDRALAAAFSLVVLALYLWTLQPGPGGPEDTPKFQCLGYVLGTAHPPGYPLYTILTHLFSYVPIRTIPWRANAFSALCGAVSVAFAWGAARQLGASRVASTGAAFGLAFTSYFWWNAILAEVYTLGTALEAALLFFLVRWQRTRRVSDLHWAVAVAGFALGNHLTILALAPACLLFAIVVDWRQAIRPRTVAINLLLGLAGLSTYSYILIRTWVGGAHLESRATNLAELFTIMRATRFSGAIGFTATDLFGVRIPLMVRELQGQVTLAGAILAIAGLGFLAWKNWRAALLLGGGLLGAVVLAAEVLADIKGFLMPALVLTWLLSASGMDVVQRILATRTGARAAFVVATLFAVLVPGWLLASNYESNNLRHATFEARYLDALFERLPTTTTAIVAEDYVVDSLIRCKAILSGRDSREPVQVIQASAAAIRRLKSSGREVFAFDGGASAATFAGYRVDPLVLSGEPLRAWLDGLPSRSLIVIAAAQRTLPAEIASRKGPAAAAWRAAQGRAHHVIVMTPRGWESAEITSRDARVDRRLTPGATIAGAGPLATDVRAVADADRAVVSVHGRQVASVYDGMVVVAVGPTGKVLGDSTYATGAPLTVPLEMARRRVYRVADERQCRAVGDGEWHDVSDVAQQGALFVRFDNARAAVARLSLYVLADDEPAPVTRARFASPAPAVEQRVFDRSIPQDADALAAALEADGVVLDGPSQRARFVVRDDLAVEDRGQQAHAVVYLGGRPARVLARGRTDRMTAPRVLVCDESLPPVIVSPATPTRLPIGASTPYYFGAGWRKAEPTPDVTAPHRWTVKPRARLLVPAAAPVSVHVQLQVRPAEGVSRIAVELNGHPLGWQTLSGDWQDLSWDTDASMWQRGLNDLTLVTNRIQEASVGDAQGRARGIDVARIQFVPTSE